MKVDHVVSLEQRRNIGRERKATAPTKKFITKRITRASIFTMAFGVVLFAFTALEFVPIIVGCGIKGNINATTGERIYHMPGQKYYFQTRINWLDGERWFCSEMDARAAGWRKARILLLTDQCETLTLIGTRIGIFRQDDRPARIAVSLRPAPRDHAP